MFYSHAILTKLQRILAFKCIYSAKSSLLTDFYSLVTYQINPANAYAGLPGPDVGLDGLSYPKIGTTTVHGTLSLR